MPIAKLMSLQTYDARMRQNGQRASDATTCASVPSLSFFFFNFFFYGFAPTQLRFMLTRLQFAPIRPELGCIGQIGSYQPTAKIDRNNHNMQKSTLNHAGTAEIGFE